MELVSITNADQLENVRQVIKKGNHTGLLDVY